MEPYPGRGILTQPPERLRSLETACGAVFGTDANAPALADVGSRLSPLAALERAALSALLHPPCLVSFSGGRDSSAVLAVAVRVARREGLPMPVPATLRFPGAELTEESGWQELLIRSLRLPDWHRRSVADELELLGPVACEALANFGAIYPANAYTLMPLLQDAAGGALVTGIDGDELFGGWQWARLMGVLHRRIPPQPRELLRLGKALAPRWLRRQVMSTRRHRAPAWLTAAGQREFAAAWGRDLSAEPVRWDRRVEWYAQRRYLAVATAVWEAMARASEVKLLHLFLDPAFLASLADAGGAVGFADRTDAMRYLFAGVLPEALITRSTKALFSQPLWGPRARNWAAAWDGGGFDGELVDAEALRRVWLSPEPDFRSALALQAAWLRASREQREQVLCGGLE